MSEQTEKSACRACGFFSGDTLAFLLLRLWLAVRAIFTGVEKFAGTRLEQTPLLDEFGNPDMSGAMVEVKVKVYGLEHYNSLPPSLQTAFSGEPLLPAWAMNAYSAALGWLLIALGLMLLVGLFTRLSLFLMGLLYISLTIGLILIGQDSGIAWLAIHVGLIALALKWSPANRCALTRVL